jgi:hypothetical protein
VQGRSGNSYTAVELSYLNEDMFTCLGPVLPPRTGLVVLSLLIEALWAPRSVLAVEMALQSPQLCLDVFDTLGEHPVSYGFGNRVMLRVCNNN